MYRPFSLLVGKRSPHEGISLVTTPQTQPSRSTEYEEAIDALKAANALSFIPGVFQRAAVRIGQYGWWGGGDKPDRPCCCIWLAVETELDASFGDPNTPLRGSAITVAIGYLIKHLGVQTIRDVFDLNDKQPTHEGQGWAMYHLNTMALKFKTEYGL